MYTVHCDSETPMINMTKLHQFVAFTSVERDHIQFSTDYSKVYKLA